ncbi:unnamed protein product, partial [Nesidiocoris tenuis]
MPIPLGAREDRTVYFFRQSQVVTKSYSLPFPLIFSGPRSVAVKDAKYRSASSRCPGTE